MPRACGATRETPDPVFSDDDGAGPVDGGAEHCRAEAAAGPRVAEGCQASAAFNGRDDEKPRACRRTTSAPRSSVEGKNYQLGHGDIVIAAITSCTNTSNPYVMVAAGLVARKARALGLTVKPWVQAPRLRRVQPGGDGVSRQVQPHRRPRRDGVRDGRLWLHHLHRQLGAAVDIEMIRRHRRRASYWPSSVLSGNRNFEGRVQSQLTRANYLASPPLVVAYALPGQHDARTSPRRRSARGRRTASWCILKRRLAVERGNRPDRPRRPHCRASSS